MYPYIHTHMCIYIYIYIYILFYYIGDFQETPFRQAPTQSLTWESSGIKKKQGIALYNSIIVRICMYVCMHVCMYVCIYVYIYIYIIVLLNKL